MLRPLGRAEDLLAAVQPRYLSPFPLPKIAYVQPRGLTVPGRAHSQDGLLIFRREGEGRDATFDGPAVEPVDLPATPRQRESAIVCFVAESEDRTPPPWADRRNLFLDPL